MRNSEASLLYYFHRHHHCSGPLWGLIVFNQYFNILYGRCYVLLYLYSPQSSPPCSFVSVTCRPGETPLHQMLTCPLCLFLKQRYHSMLSSCQALPGESAALLSCLSCSLCILTLLHKQCTLSLSLHNQCSLVSSLPFVALISHQQDRDSCRSPCHI